GRASRRTESSLWNVVIHRIITYDTKPPSGNANGWSLTRVVHQRPCSRYSASSANPAPEAARVTYFGLSESRSSKRRTLATPTECPKKANIGASAREELASLLTALAASRRRASRGSAP